MRHLHSCIIASILVVGTADAKIDRFTPNQHNAAEVWRITHDPTMRDWANYHNTDAWSPDGRYISYVHYEPYETIPNEFTHTVAQTNKEIHVYDLHEQRDLVIGNGSNPRWANRHNWLFYLTYHPEDGPPTGRGTHVMWLDLDTGRKTRISYGVASLGETDAVGEPWTPCIRLLCGCCGVRSIDNYRSRDLRKTSSIFNRDVARAGQWSARAEGWGAHRCHTRTGPARTRLDGRITSLIRNLSRNPQQDRSCRTGLCSRRSPCSCN